MIMCTCFLLTNYTSLSLGKLLQPSNPSPNVPSLPPVPTPEPRRPTTPQVPANLYEKWTTEQVVQWLRTKNVEAYV